MEEEVENWIRKAEEDLEAAKVLGESSSDSISAYHLQQSAEKALKAMLLEIEGDYPYIHDLVELSQDLEIPERFRGALSELNPMYYSTRYPDQVEENVENLGELTQYVEELVKWIKGQLKK